MTGEINWDKPQCWIIDEATLLADHELDRPIRAADSHNIKLVFLGDREQGKDIGAIGAYAQLEDTYGTVCLPGTNNRGLRPSQRLNDHNR